MKMKIWTVFLLIGLKLCSSSFQASCQSVTVVTVAGTGGYGWQDGPGNEAMFAANHNLVLDSHDNIYIADSGNNRIRKVTPFGHVSTVAGSGGTGSTNGAASTATFNYPTGITRDAAGNLYVGDFESDLIRKISIDGVVSTIAGIAGSPGLRDGSSSYALLDAPRTITIDKNGALYFTQTADGHVRKISITDGSISVSTVLALADTAGNVNIFGSPEGLFVDEDMTIYVTVYSAKRIRRILTSGLVVTVAGSGNAASIDGQDVSASFNGPIGLTMTSDKTIYVAEFESSRIRAISPTGYVSTLSGSSAGHRDGAANIALFNQPNSIALDSQDNLIVSERGGNKIRKIVICTSSATYNAAKWSCQCNEGYEQLKNGKCVICPTGQVVNEARTACESIRIPSNPPKLTISTVAGICRPLQADDNVSADANSGLLDNPSGILIDLDETKLFISDTGNDCVKKLNISTGEVSPFVGQCGIAGYKDGVGTYSKFNQPYRLAFIDSKNGKIVIADVSNNAYRFISPSGSVNSDKAAGWQIQMMFPGLKPSGWSSSDPRFTKMGSAGSPTFMSITAANTGANQRTTLAQGEGLYSSFFSQNYITKVAFVDGSAATLDPMAHNNYLVYDLVESSGSESFADILKRLDVYMRDSPSFSNNDAVFGSPSVLQFTAGINGYSGLLSAHGGTWFSSSTLPAKFCVMGINRDADNDIQALCAYWGDLNSGKGDSWRSSNPLQTFWSYWGNDFHSSSQFQRIGSSSQTPPGVSTGLTWTGNVYILAKSGFNNPRSVATDSGNGNMYIADTANHCIWKIVPGSSASILAGKCGSSGNNGNAAAESVNARFNSPSDLLWSPSNNNLLISDTGNHCIRRVLSNGNVIVETGLCGTSGNNGQNSVTKNAARFFSPQGLALGAAGEIIVADTENHCIRTILQNSTVAVRAGLCGTSGSNTDDVTVDSARFYRPTALSFGEITGNLYMADSSNNCVRKIKPDCGANADYNVTLDDCISNMCDAGFERNFVKNSCDRCRLGYFKSTNDSSACLQCPIGTQSSFNFSNCENCTIGVNYRSSLKQDGCIPCPGNSICTTTWEFSCNPGFELTQDNTECQLCQEGYFKSTTDNSSCLPCPLGTESSVDMVSCVPCPSEKYRPKLSFSKCIPCPGNSTCTTTTTFSCNPGFELIKNDTGCRLCQEGFSKSTLDNTPCASCPIGAESFLNKTACVPCSSDKYRPNVSFTKCIPCPGNSTCTTPSTFSCNPGYELINNVTGCQICQQGYSKSDIDNSQCLECPIGTESSLNKSTCEPCPPAKYRPNLSFNKCIKCPENATCWPSYFVCNPGFAVNFTRNGCNVVPLVMLPNINTTRNNVDIFNGTKILYKKPACDLQKLKAVISDFDSAMSGLDGQSIPQNIENAMMRISAIAISDSWLNCEKIIRNSAVIGLKNSTSVTKECPFKFGTFEYAHDPCCNNTLGFSTCCAARFVSISYDTVVSIDTDYVVRNCDVNENNIVNVIDTLNNYFADRTSALHRESGCLASSMRTLKSKDAKDAFSFWKNLNTSLDKCAYDIFGVNFDSAAYRNRDTGIIGKKCRYHNECYTSCFYTNEGDRFDPNKWGHCVIPWSQQSKYLGQCFFKTMDSSVTSALARLWGLLRKNETSFIAEFVKRMSVETCTGETAYVYQGGYYTVKSSSIKAPSPHSNSSLSYSSFVYDAISNGDYVYVGTKLVDSMIGDESFFYIPANRTLCLSEKRANFIQISAESKESGNLTHFCGRLIVGDLYKEVPTSICNTGSTSNQYCTSFCQSCKPADIDVTSICFAPDTDQNCAELGKQVQIASGKYCAYSSTEGLSYCESLPNSFTKTCEDFDKGNCHSNGWEMECSWGYIPCSDEESCLEAGSCLDSDISINNLLESSAGGVCLLPGVFDVWGNRNCNNVYQNITSKLILSKSGCLFHNVSEAVCAHYGGALIQDLSDSDQCTSIKGCCEGDSACNGGLSAKNLMECETCNGKLMPYFQWSGGEWRDSQIIEGSWIERKSISINSWTNITDLNLFRDYVNLAIGSQLSEILKPEMACRYRSVVDYLKQISCRCGINVDDSCAAKVSEVKQVASGSLICGEAKSVQSGSLSVKFASDSIQECGEQVTFDINKLEPAAVGTINATETLGKRSNLMKRALVTADCYGYVKNGHGAYVGQIRGDCVSLNPSSRINNVEICMPLKSTIPWDETEYPVAGAAIRTLDSNGDPVYSIGNYTLLESNNQFCIRVSEKGTYCPVSAVSNYVSVTSRILPSCDLGSSSLDSINTATAKLAGTARKVKILMQPPSEIVAGVKFPRIIVRLLDNDNKLVTDASISATLTVISPTTGTSIIGTPRVAAVEGFVIFDDIAVNLVGTNNYFVVSASYLTIDRSNTFSVTPGPPYGLSFSQQAGGAVSNQLFLQPAKVSVVDFFGNKVPSSNASITVTPFYGSVPASFTAGTSTRSASSGVSTFDDVILSQVGAGYSLKASSPGLVSAVSSTFNVVPDIGVAVKLRFKQGTIPAQTDAGSPFSKQPRVEILDYQNQVVTAATGSITIALKANTGTAKAVLSGTKTVNAINGVASFSGLSIDRYGSSYVLTASSKGLSNSDSNPFRINGAAGLSFVSSPTGVVNGTFDVLVNVVDEFGQVFTTGSFILYLNIKPFTGSSRAVLAGTTRTMSAGGSALFEGVSITIPAADYVLIVTDDSNILKAESAKFGVISPEDFSKNENEAEIVTNSIISYLAAAANVSVDLFMYVLFFFAGMAVLILVMSAGNRYELAHRPPSPPAKRPRRRSRSKSKRSNKVAPAPTLPPGYVLLPMPPPVMTMAAPPPEYFTPAPVVVPPPTEALVPEPTILPVPEPVHTVTEEQPPVQEIRAEPTVEPIVDTTATELAVETIPEHVEPEPIVEPIVTVEPPSQPPMVSETTTTPSQPPIPNMNMAMMVNLKSKMVKKAKKAKSNIAANNNHQFDMYLQSTSVKKKK